MKYSLKYILAIAAICNLSGGAFAMEDKKEIFPEQLKDVRFVIKSKEDVKWILTCKQYPKDLVEKISRKLAGCSFDTKQTAKMPLELYIKNHYLRDESMTRAKIGDMAEKILWCIEELPEDRD